MARYMLSVHSVEGDVREPPTPDEMEHKLAIAAMGGDPGPDWN